MIKGGFAAFVFLVLYISLSLSKYAAESGWALVLFFMSLAIAFRGKKNLRGFSFTAMIFGVVSAGLYFPQYFVQIGGLKLSALIIPLLNKTLHELEIFLLSLIMKPVKPASLQCVIVSLKRKNNLIKKED